MLVLTCQAKQVALVVKIEVAVRPHQDHAVVVAAGVADYEAAAQHGAGLFRRFGHPGHRGSVHALRVGFGVHREAGREHLRQHDEIRRAFELLQRAREFLQVLPGVVPVQVGLHDRNVQSWHKRRAASSRVASSLAKQKRSLCPGSGSSQNTDTGIEATPISRVRRRAYSTSGSSVISE